MIHLSLCLVAAAIAALALFVWRARPDSKVNRWFAAFTFSTAGWVLGVAGFFGGTHVDAWGRFTFASASWLPSSVRMQYEWPDSSGSAARDCAINALLAATAGARKSVVAISSADMN